ncbi:MAG: 2,3-bisphosphoglycerate-independent phosphoglycerate mutase, partial [Phycisphaerales bacterium]|nr:2,3-bisphosphoglycerate-independent phosphoglycerate mutase [Phycisphaerales bacterium]
MAKKPLVLIVRDGWGIGTGDAGDAVSAANTPNMDAILDTCPTCTIDAAGSPVGVRDGSQGSSEVGHLNLGAGRIVKQEILRVDDMIADGSLFQVPRYREAIERCKTTGAAFHLMGLVQDQGVHATEDHLHAFLRELAAEGVSNVVVHFFSDGRDTAPQSALGFLDKLEAVLAETGGRIGTLMGRYYAMDRAENWDRTKRAYDLLLCGTGHAVHSAREAIELAYARAETQKAEGADIVENDEFIDPSVIVDAEGAPVGIIKPGDCVLHLNYRQDRALQLTNAFVDEPFGGFDRAKPDVFYMGLTRYFDEFTFELVPPMNMANLLGEVISAKGLRQLRIAEFQKYKHVTSFFNGKLLEPYTGEDRILVDSISIPEDQKPAMSAYEVTDLALVAISESIGAARDAAESHEIGHYEGKDPEDACACELKDTYDVIVLNYANCDMVGHTGVFEAARQSVEVTDECLGKVVEATLERGGALLITSDHGNAERMADEQGNVQTAHTTNLVTCSLVSN